MIAVNLNSVIVNEVKPTDAYWTGFANFCDGQTLEEQPTWNHRNGWMWALSRQAEAEYVPSNSVSWIGAQS